MEDGSEEVGGDRDRRRSEGPSTRAVHAGEGAFTPAGRPTVAPIFQTAPWSFDSLAALEAAGSGEPVVTTYSRYGNPTVRVVEEKIAALEEAEDAIAFASGMAAISATLVTLLRPGQRLLAAEELYGGSESFLGWWAERQPDLVVERVPLTAIADRLAAEAASGSADAAGVPPLAAVYLETPSNPLLTCCDLAAVAAGCRRIGRSQGDRVRLVVDGTFAPPPVQQAIGLGADLVVHSATKFLSGHSDVIAGVVVGGREDLAAIRRTMITTGGCLDPHAAFLVGRGMKTLTLRLERQVANAERIARLLAAHPAVHRLAWPGSDPTAREQMSSGGTMIAFELAGGEAAVVPFVETLRLVRLVPSLGGVESGVSVPARSSHRSLGVEGRRARGIGEGLLRLSCGIEDGDDLAADLGRALDAVTPGGRSEATTGAEVAR